MIIISNPFYLIFKILPCQIGLTVVHRSHYPLGGCVENSGGKWIQTACRWTWYPTVLHLLLLLHVFFSLAFTDLKKSVSGTAGSLSESRFDLSVPGMKLDTMDIQVHKMFRDHWKDIDLFSFALFSTPVCFAWYVLSSGQGNLGKVSLSSSGWWKKIPLFTFKNWA